MCKLQKYTTIEAAGGIVENEKGEILLIFRREKWDFPKGKVEYGESVSDAALREVTEETGIQELTLGTSLPDTQHTYTLNEDGILKTTHWYRMTAPSQPLVPQAEEDIAQALWVPKAQVSDLLQENSFPTLITLWEAYRKNYYDIECHE